MTYVYFVRHAESIYLEGQERSRGLSEGGIEAALSIKDILSKEDIDYYISSPYQRAIDTIRPTALDYAKDIKIVEELRERELGDFEPLSFLEAKRKVYEDMDYSFSGGESSVAAQKRAVEILKKIIIAYKGKRIVIGTHGDIMCLMMNHYDKYYGFDFWQSTSMPDIYKLSFENERFIDAVRLIPHALAGITGTINIQ